MKRNYLLWLFCTIFALCSCNKEEEDGGGTRSGSPRTVLMYLVADNSIGYDVIANISDVEEGLKSSALPEGTFVIYVDGGSYMTTYSTPTMFKYEIDKNGKVGARQVIKSYPEQNSCSSTVITQVIKDMKQLCPANSYALTFGSHATGWLPVNTSKTRSLGDDSGSKIDVPDFANALANADVHFDYILMDACLMSQVEVAYELRNAADYLILSPAEVMAYGFPYKKMVGSMLASDDLESEVIDMAQAFIDYYKTYSYPWATIAVVKSSKMDALASATADMIDKYSDRLSIFTESKLNSMQKSCNYGRGSMANSSYDFKCFARELTDNRIPANFLNALNDAVVYKDYVNGYKLPNVNIDADYYSGIGCYIPYPTYTKWNEYYQSLSWNKATNIID